MLAGLPPDSLLSKFREIAPKLEVATVQGDQLTLDQPIGGSNPPSPAFAGVFSDGEAPNDLIGNQMTGVACSQRSTDSHAAHLIVGRAD